MLGAESKPCTTTLVFNKASIPTVSLESMQQALVFTLHH